MKIPNSGILLSMSEANDQRAVEIRPALPEDADGIATIFLESAAYHAQLDPERYLTPTFETISARYRKVEQHPTDDADSAASFIAELHGQIVGFIDVVLDRSPDAMHREMTYCHIAEIAVRDAYQGKGIGRRLLQTAEDWGREMGAEFASLEFHARNERASSFYQDRMGFHAAATTAIKRLRS